MEEPIVLTASNIRYLLAMKELDHDGSGVRCSAIANALRLSKPSVHNMMNTFRRLGLVQKDAYRACFFTDRGNEIAARYGLALHTERRAIANAGDQSREHGAYEDGSFHISAAAIIGQERYLYEVYLEKSGCLPCDDMTAGGACEYEEWEYTAGRGDKVSIAVRDMSTNEAWAQYELLVLYSGDGAVMTVRAS